MELRHLISLIFSSFILRDFIAAGESKEQTFHVEPGAGTLSVDGIVGDYKCTFTYAAQGGTNEEWAISLEVQDNGKQVICTVQRGIASYIYFEKFSMKLKGPHAIAIADKEVLSSQRDNKPLMTDEYTIDKNSISSVPGKFKNQLEKVAVLAATAREDL